MIASHQFFPPHREAADMWVMVRKRGWRSTKNQWIFINALSLPPRQLHWLLLIKWRSWIWTFPFPRIHFVLALILYGTRPWWYSTFLRSVPVMGGRLPEGWAKENSFCIPAYLSQDKNSYWCAMLNEQCKIIIRNWPWSVDMLKVLGYCSLFQWQNSPNAMRSDAANIHDAGLLIIHALIMDNLWKNSIYYQ